MWEGAVGLGTRLTDEERARIAELAAARLPGRLIAKAVGRSHRAVWSYVLKLRQPVAPAVTAAALAGGAGGDIPRPRGR
jgi:hypothetical protein